MVAAAVEVGSAGCGVSLSRFGGGGDRFGFPLPCSHVGSPVWSKLAGPRLVRVVVQAVSRGSVCVVKHGRAARARQSRRRGRDAGGSAQEVGASCCADGWAAREARVVIGFGHARVDDVAADEARRIAECAGRGEALFGAELGFVV